MTQGRARLWDSQQRDSYVNKRDEALEHRARKREGTYLAREIDSAWILLDLNERAALQYLVLCGARSCVGRCNDSLLSTLVERGFLAWPPGVRPVLTEDLVTVFMIPPAVWTALDERRDAFLPEPREREAFIVDAREKFSERLIPVADIDGPDPTVSV